MRAVALFTDRSRSSAFRWTAALAVPLLIYAWRAIPLAHHHRERLNVDAVCYIRRAMYWSAGDICHAISGYWSPLLSWLVVPLLRAGADPLYAARAVMCFCGAAAVACFGLLLYRLRAFGPLCTFVALTAMAMATPAIAVREITPDLLLSACLLAYLAALADDKLASRKTTHFLAGALGGLAYLAKAYAFPFVLTHLPLTMFIFLGRRALYPIARSLAAFALVAGPWIAALSWRYGALTISTAGPRAHAVLAPDNPSREHRWSMSIPPDPYIIEFENPETMRYTFWSPFANRRNLTHQLHIVRDNLLGTPAGAQPPAQGLIPTIAAIDPLRLAPAALLLSPLAAAGLLTRPGRQRAIAWLAATAALYCAGFLPVFFIPRYVQPFIWPLCLGLAMLILLELRWLPPAARIAAAALAACSFAAPALPPRGEPRATAHYRILAAQVSTMLPAGPFAAGDRRNLAFLALHSGRKAVAIPHEGDPAAIDADLARLGVNTLVVWPLRTRERNLGIANMAERIAAAGGWKLAFHFGPPDGGADVYQRALEAYPTTCRHRPGRDGSSMADSTP